MDLHSHITSLFDYVVKPRERAPAGLDKASVNVVVTGDSMNSTAEMRLTLKDRYLRRITIFITEGMRNRYAGNAAA